MAAYMTPKSVLLGTGLALAVWALPYPAAADFVLHVLHTNDIHSRLEPINRFDTTCGAEEAAKGECLGGAARLAHELARLRGEFAAKNEAVIYLDAGDVAQGSLLYTKYRGAAEGEIMEMLRPDVMALGNHEFDHGPEGLAVFLDQISFPVISGNIEVADAPEIAGRVGQSIVLERGDMRIGIISALAEDTASSASPGPDVRFHDAAASLRDQVQKLEAEGVDKIIALTHLGLNRDLEIAKIAGIDAVVGGHSHSYLSASDPAALGPYPIWVEAETGKTPVVTAYAYGKYLGHVTLRFSDDGALLDAQGDVILLESATPEDAAVKARLTALAAPLEALRAQVLGQAAAVIDGQRESCRQMECAMGNLFADAILARTKSQGVQAVILNGGSLRASIDQGPITMGEVLSVSPFQNTLSTFTLSGALLIEALENGLMEVEDLGGQFPQVAGIRYQFDGNRPKGARLVAAQIEGPAGWENIDPSKDYLLASNDYMRRGGNDYTMLLEARDAYDFGPDLAELVGEYLAQNQPYQPKLDGRISRIDAAGQP